MPYVPEEDKNIRDDSGKLQNVRPLLDPHIEALAAAISEAHKEYGYDGAFSGLCNYSMTRIFCLVLLQNFPRLRYFMSPLVRGTCMDIADEFYRRVISPYEDVQIDKNGDVPEYLKLRNSIK